ncbi:hypothetical protein H4S06_003705 [Coemansia sp. BCRC 34490]|nr:hypothetical protein LPJ72_003804 [Coemansia sp. Benny D160-2]KAJ2753667.1 hypothetical protein H4S06_003705 [Coemansia sp. BCRC 34490]
MKSAATVIAVALWSMSAWGAESVAAVAAAAGAPSGSATLDADAVCNSSCQMITDVQQHSTCMQMCKRFAEQGVMFSPAMTTHGAMATGAAQKSSSAQQQQSSSSAASSAADDASSAASSSSLAGMADKAGKLRGEDNDEDEESAGMSSSGMSASRGMMSSAPAAACLSTAALLAAGLFCVSALL